MKAITIWQPWASLIASGAKQFETRGWETKHRGKIAIHAAKIIPREIGVVDRSFCHAVQRALFPNAKDVDMWSNIVQLLPRGAIVAIGDLTACHLISGRTTVGPEAVAAQAYVGGKLTDITTCTNELLFGDWTLGRFAWELQNVELLETPIYVTGRQGLWNWEESDDDTARD